MEWSHTGATPRHPPIRALRRAQIQLTAVATVLLIVGFTACDERSPTGADTRPSAEIAGAGATADVVASSGVGALGTIALPINQSAASSGPLFGLTQTGSGGAGDFRIENPNSGQIALSGRTVGPGTAVAGITPAGTSGTGVMGQAYGTGIAVKGVASGTANAAVFENTSALNSKPVLHVKTNGTGWTGAFIATNPEAKGVYVASSSSSTTLDAENLGTGFAAKFFGYGTAKGVYIQTQGGAGLQVVGGSKNAVVRTPSGAKALYTEESTEVWFTDYGFGKLHGGHARVLLDPSFAQTINPDEPYHVFLQARGRAELYVGETTPLGFEVALKDGDPNAEFSYRVVAKRLGFEGKRLERAPWVDEMATGFKREPR